jgi:hypothetical protein
LEEEQKKYREHGEGGHISKLMKYSLATSTTTMNLHLANIHDVHLERRSLVSSKNSTNYFKDVNKDLVIWLALDLEPFSFVDDKGQHYFLASINMN